MDKQQGDRRKEGGTYFVCEMTIKSLWDSEMREENKMSVFVFQLVDSRAR